MNVWDTRLTAHVFTLIRGDERREFTFYARTSTAGLVLARKWAAPRGWSVSPDAIEREASVPTRVPVNPSSA